jgi:hypothetical protein
MQLSQQPGFASASPRLTGAATVKVWAAMSSRLNRMAKVRFTAIQQL